MMQTRLRAASLALSAALLLAASATASDYVVAGGERIEGHDLALFDGRVMIMATDGARRFDLAEVEAFGLSGARDLTTASGEKLVIESAEYMAGPEGGLSVRSKSLGEIAMDISAVESIASAGAKSRYAAEFGRFVTRGGALVEAHGWKGTLGLSMVHARGVARSRSFSASADATRVDGPWRTALAGQYALGSADGVTATDTARAEAKLDRFLSLRSYAYGSALVFRDGVADIDPRVAVGVGGGYRFLGGPSHDLSAEAGYEFLTERVGGAPFEEDSFVRFAANYALKAGEGRIFTQKAEVSFAVSGESRTRARSDSALSVMLNHRMSLRVGFVIEHDTEPPAGSPSTATRAETALVLSF